MPLPAPRLIVLIMVAAPVFLAGALYPPLAALGVIYLMILAGCMALSLLLLPRKKHITLRRVLPHAGRLSLAEPAPVTLEVTNRSRQTLQIQFAENVPDRIDASPVEGRLTLAPGAQGRVEYRLTAHQRGRYALDRVDVRLLPSAGLFFRQFAVSLPAEVRVFPNLVNIRRYELQLRRGLTWEQGLARLYERGAGSEFESLRFYAEGDEMSRVDWKATAKRGRLVVRNYEAERQQSVIVAIDAGRATAGEFGGLSRLDYLVNAALMLAYVSLRQGDWFSLVAFSDRIESYLPPVRRLQSLDRVARALHEIQPRLAESDYAAACRFMGLKSRKRSLIVLMTDVIDRDASEVVIAYLARYARRHLPLAVTLLNPEIRDLAHEPLAGRERDLASDIYAKAAALDILSAREEALLAMRRKGVGVLDVEPQALTPELINRYLLIKSTRRL